LDGFTRAGTGHLLLKVILWII